MGKIPSIPSDSERTISDDFVGNQTEDDALEAESAMVLPAVTEKEETSDSERTLQGDRFGQIAGHGYTDGLEVDSVSRAKRAVVKSKSLQVPLDDWLEEIDSGEEIWTATKRFRSDGKKYDMYYFHNEYDYAFRSKPNVMEFLRNGTVNGQVIEKKTSVGTTTNGHDYRQINKRQRTGTATSSNTSGSIGSTRGRMAPTRTKLPHGFL